MNGVAWFFSIFVAVLFCVLFGLTFVRQYARYNSYRLSVLVGVNLPPRLEPAISARLMARDRGTAIGAFAFAVAAVLAFQFGIFAGADSYYAFLFVAGTAVTGACVGSAVAAFSGSRTIAPDAPRVARSSVAAVADYVHPIERIGVRVVVAASVVVLIVAATTTTGIPILVTAFLTVMGVASLALFEVVSRRIVDRSQPAGSTADLVWDDAIRSSLLRDLLTAPAALGAFGLIFATATLIDNGTASSTATDATSLGLSFSGLAVALYGRFSRPRRYFVGRLWPNLRWSDTADEMTDAA